MRTIRVPIGVMPRALTRPGHSKLEWTTEEDHLRTTSPIETFPVRIRDGFEFSPDGWHPYIETLRQYVENPEIKFEQTILCEYFRDVLREKRECHTPPPSFSTVFAGSS